MARSWNNSSSWSWAGPALVVYTILLIVGMALIWRLWPASPAAPPGADPTAKSRPVTPPGPPASDEETRIEVYSKAKVSVVNVSSAQFRRNRFTLDLKEVLQGSGTGFIWDEKGRIVTNYHVIAGADKVRITLDDHSSYEAVQTNYNKQADLAVLWANLPAAKSIPLPIGESSKLRVGQNVLAIGNPFGLDHSLSSGIISALGRSVKTEGGQVSRDLIQTTAAINPGNSGGPLLDSSGRLIGVNSAIVSPSGAFAGIGFAIPVDTVNRVVPDLIRGVKQGRPGLGINPAPDQWARQLGTDGVLILDVLPDGPAAKAGLRPTRTDEDTDDIRWGDIIVALDSHPVHSVKQFYSVLQKDYHVGDEVTVHFLRGGKVEQVKLTLTTGAQ